MFARLAALSERISGIRGWAALPGAVLIVSLTVAVFGMYWDISTHLDNGRDPGPLAPMPTPTEKITASVSTRELTGDAQRTIAAKIELAPPGAAEGAEWLNITGWQGGGSVVDRLRETGPGTYETTKPIPVHGNWKTTLRLQRGRAVLGLPVYFPADPAIPVKGVPAPGRFTRQLIFDKDNLQREQKKGVSPILTTAAYLAVLALALALLAAITLGLRRLERSHLGTSCGPIVSRNLRRTRGGVRRPLEDPFS